MDATTKPLETMCDVTTEVRDDEYIEIRMTVEEANRIGTAIDHSFTWSRTKYPRLWPFLCHLFKGTNDKTSIDELLKEV